jgi:hypothetical protein
MLWFPPIHELGHMIICKIENVDIYSVEFASMTHAACDRVTHISWDIVTAWIPMIFCILYLILYYEKNSRKNQAIQIT